MVLLIQVRSEPDQQKHHQAVLQGKRAAKLAQEADTSHLVGKCITNIYTYTRSSGTDCVIT